MNISWHPVEDHIRFATVTDHRAQTDLHLVVERLPTADGWDWAIWHPYGPAIRQDGRTLSSTLSMAFAAKAAERAFVWATEAETLEVEHTPVGRTVLPDDFQIAADRARAASGGRPWEKLTLHEQAEAIYRELRVIDEDRAADRNRKRAL